MSSLLTIAQLSQAQWLSSLVGHETGDAKSSTDAVGAAHQYPGSVGGVDLVPRRGAPDLRHRRRTTA
jgi:hypothetical protein